MQWLVRDVPGVGRGLSGAFMDYPWWFGTETYSLKALIASGDPELAKETLRLLAGVSAKANANGRIVHEVSTNGVVNNPGNTQETAEFVATAGMLVEWTGDLAFAREIYPAMKQGILWLMGAQDQNHDLFPEGYGIMEVLGLNADRTPAGVQAPPLPRPRPRAPGPGPRRLGSYGSTFTAHTWQSRLYAVKLTSSTSGVR